jgi:hypothetical protein
MRSPFRSPPEELGIMTPNITRQQASTLLRMALSNQGDPLGFRDFHPADDESEEMNEHDVDDAMLELAHEALVGSQPAVTRHVHDHMVQSRMDAATADVLLHHGIDPVAALVLDDMFAGEEDGLCIMRADEDGSGIMHLVAERRGSSWRLPLAPDSDDGETPTWHSDGGIVLGAMPDVLAAAAIGRPVSEIVSHPALDRHALIVSGVDQGSEVSILRFDRQPTLDKRALIRHLSDSRTATRLGAAA